jgi:hypothetical protein
MRWALKLAGFFCAAAIPTLAEQPSAAGGNLHGVEDAVVGLEIVRDPRPSAASQYGPGDSCKVWKRRATIDVRNRFESSSCATAESPRDLLTLNRWLRSPPASTDVPTRADYEVILQLDITARHAPSQMRTTRRHGDWVYVDETTDGVSTRLTITNQVAGFRMEHLVDAAHSSERLFLTRIWDELTAQAVAPKDLNRSERILGELCEWFDVLPNVMDGGTDECRTNDGVTLKSIDYAFSTPSQVLTAIRLTRRPPQARRGHTATVIARPQEMGA